MVDFMRNKNKNSKLKQSEKPNQSRYFSFTLQRYRKAINMLSPYRIQPKNTNKRTRRLQTLILTTTHIANMTSKDLN